MLFKSNQFAIPLGGPVLSISLQDPPFPFFLLASHIMIFGTCLAPAGM